MIRFKRQTLINFGRRKISNAAADAAEVYDSLPASLGKILKSCTGSEASVSVVTELAQDNEQMKKVLTDISAFDISRIEPVTATKHPEVNFRFLHGNFFQGGLSSN